MSPLLLCTVLQTLSLSQGFNITDVLPSNNVKKPEDHSTMSSMLQYDISTGSDSRDVAVLQCTATKFCNTKQCPTVGLSMLGLSQGCSGVLRVRRTNVSLNLLDAQEQKTVADQICVNLGCGREHAVKTIRSGVCFTDCILKESKLHNCTTTAEGDCTNATEVVCEHQAVRLAEGRDRCAGRVELLFNRQWGTVCDDDFDSRSGHVVCGQLGCGSMKAVGFFGAGTGLIHINRMKCKGTERNLWECSVNDTTSRDYCGHKEDIGVVCSESTELPLTTNNTTYLPFMTWTTDSVAVVAVEHSAGVSPAVIGCIILAVALLLFILSNVAVCVHYRRKACEIQQHESIYQPSTDYQPSARTGIYNPRITTTAGAQSTHQYESLGPRPSSKYHRYDRRDSRSSHSSTSDIDYEHYNFGALLPYENPPVVCCSVNMNDSSSTSSGEAYQNTNINMDTIHKSGGNEIPSALDKSPLAPLASGVPAIHSKAVDLNDSSSTSSGEFYTNTKTDMDNITKSNEEASLQEGSPLTTPSYNSQHLPETAENVNDSDSRSSAEVYQNTEEDNLQSVEGSPSLPVLSLQTPHNDQMTGTAYSSIHRKSDGNDSDSTSSGECYQNTEPHQSGKESPSPPETSLQTPLNHLSAQMTGSTVDYEDHQTPRNLSQETDNSSTSSDNLYVNVPPKNESDEECSPAREQDSRLSSDDDYDEPENW